MKLFDARVCLGRDVSLDAFQCSDLKAVRSMLDKYGIEKAFLSSFVSFRLDVSTGNEITFHAAQQDSRLIPCPVVLPDSAGEVGDETRFIAGLVERGARCVGFYPNTIRTTCDNRIIGGLFQAIQKHHLPVSVTQDELPLMELAELAEQYADTPFIYVSPPYRTRSLLPVLKNVRNIHLAIDAPFAWNHGPERIVEVCGSEQLLYASNFPVAEPGVPISHMAYSKLSDSHLENISFRNMQRLIEGVTDGKA